MELTPGIKAIDPHGGGQQGGTGRFDRKRKEPQSPSAQAVVAPGNDMVPEVDPLLAELDRLRAVEPGQPESGQYRSILAHRAYVGRGLHPEAGAGI